MGSWTPWLTKPFAISKTVDAPNCESLREQEVLTCYDRLSPEIRTLADENFELLRKNPRHPSLHFKEVGRYGSVRGGEKHRTLGVESPRGIVWFWIGLHSEYDRITRK
jgi:hypothetical protein